MSYLRRLVEQSGLRPGQVGAVFPLPPLRPGWSGHRHGAEGGEEVDVVVETAPAPPAPRGRPVDPPAPDIAPAVTRPATPRLNTAAADPTEPGPVRLVVSDQQPERGPDGKHRLTAAEPDRRHRPGHAEPAQDSEPVAPHHDQTAEVPASHSGAGEEQSVSRHETLLRVVEWLAADQPSTPAAEPRHDQVEPRRSAEAIEPPPGRSAEAAPLRTPSTRREGDVEQTTRPTTEASTAAPVEVWIDAVNLTLEAPPPAATTPAVVSVPPPPAPRRSAGPPARTTTTDRLRRRYLRA